jgi:hypothetical protein
MKIILVDEEAYQYMDMKEDITRYKERIAELSDALVKFESEAISSFEYKKNISPYNEQHTHNYPAGAIREEHTSTRWNDFDIQTLTERIFLTGTYYGEARTIETVHSLFPIRTRAAVTAMIYHLGGTVKKGIVHPRIKPKHKGE